jgi:uncharacterized protein (DUF58 family)
MIVPRGRLLFWVAFVGVPFGVLAGTLASALPVSLGILILLALCVAVDAMRAGNALKGISAHLPPRTRLAMNREGCMILRLQNSSQREMTLRLALPLSGDAFSAKEEMTIKLPRGVEWSEIPWALKPTRRGIFSLSEVFIETPSPMGFWNARGQWKSEAELRVYPNLQKDIFRLQLMFRGASGNHAGRQIGKGREFEKLRDYVPGDCLSDIHWKATARRARPITKVFQIERTQEVYVALDTSRLSARSAAMETMISTTLLLGLAAESQGDLFGLLSFSDHVENFVRAGSGKAHYQACREAIFSATPRPVNPDFNEIFTFLRLRLRRRALVIFLTALDDPLLAESFLHNAGLVSRQHLLVAAMITPPGIGPLFQSPDVAGVDEIYDRLAGHLRWNAMEELRSSLQHKGVRFLTTESNGLLPELISEYLAVKNRQLL